MVKRKKIIKDLNAIILNENLSEENTLVLIEAKRALITGYCGDSMFNNLMFSKFYPKYTCEIAAWLGETKESIEKRIFDKSFTSAEHKLILTNILIKENEGDVGG